MRIWSRDPCDFWKAVARMISIFANLVVRLRDHSLEHAYSAILNNWRDQIWCTVKTNKDGTGKETNFDSFAVETTFEEKGRGTQQEDVLVQANLRRQK